MANDQSLITLRLWGIPGRDKTPYVLGAFPPSELRRLLVMFGGGSREHYWIHVPGVAMGKFSADGFVVDEDMESGLCYDLSVKDEEFVM
ncbi:MAG: hypothetical protein AB1941_21830 [Gemmatimonadota bacterium]